MTARTRSGLHDVPVLDNAPVLDAKDVHDGLSGVVRGHLHVVVEDHEVVLSDHPREVEGRFRYLDEETTDEGGEYLLPVRGCRVVLLVGCAQVAVAGLLRLAVDESRVEEVQDNALSGLRIGWINQLFRDRDIGCVAVPARASWFRSGYSTLSRVNGRTACERAGLACGGP
jgi:hypothetical protein